jgi:hypothetical protein
MRRWVPALLVLLLIAAGGWLYGSPYLTVAELKRAADARDLDTISERIDYPSVRASLKTQLRARLGRGDETGLGVVGAALAERFAEPAIDVAVTPEAMRSIFASAAVAQAAQPRSLETRARDMQVRRESLSRFALAPKNGAGPALVFELQGLQWRLTAMRLPEGRLR